MGTFREMGRWRRHIFDGVARGSERVGILEDGSRLKTPWRELPAEAQELVLYGTGDRHITFAWKQRGGGVYKHGGKFEGVVADLFESYR